MFYLRRYSSNFQLWILLVNYCANLLVIGFCDSRQTCWFWLMKRLLSISFSSCNITCSKPFRYPLLQLLQEPQTNGESKRKLFVYFLHKSENRQLEVKCFSLKEFSFFFLYIRWKKKQYKTEFEDTSEPSMVSHKYGHPLTGKIILASKLFHIKSFIRSKTNL